MESSKELIEELAFNEEKIMELYWIYENKFPALAKTWRNLAEEEKNHASMLGGFAELAGAGGIEAELNKIDMNVIHRSIEFLKIEIEKARTTKMEASYALDTALKIENSLLEKEIFTVLMSSDNQLKELFKKLNDDTKRHYEMLKNVIKKQKK